MTPSPSIFLSELLDALQREGYKPGINTLMQLEQVLDHIPEEMPQERWGNQFAPLLARTKLEQERIYGKGKEILEKWVQEEAEMLEKSLELEKQVEALKKKERRKFLLPIGIVGLMLVGLLIFLVTRPEPQEIVEQETKPDTNLTAPPEGIVDTLIRPTAAQFDTIEIDLPSLNTIPEVQQANRLLPEIAYEYPWITRAIWALFWALILLGVVWYLNRQRFLVAKRSKAPEKPPFGWNLQPEAPKQIGYETGIEGVFRQMRGRESSEVQRLDIPGTVQASIRKGGQIDFQYKYLTRPSEYLILIDHGASQNHQAALFNLLYENFKAEEVEVVRYYFDGDVRHVWNEEEPGGGSLKDLQSRYPDHRLLIFGRGYGWLNRRTGKPAAWTDIFTSWEHRALLTPQPAASWGRRESLLSRMFVLLPSGIEGLKQLIEQLEGEKPNKLNELKQEGIESDDVPFRPGEDLIQSLEEFTVEQPGMMRWIAACAVYPSLHWDLTLFLGKLLETEDAPLLTYGNINRMARISWLEQGQMSEEVQRQLLDWLQAYDDGKTEQEVRVAINEMMLKAEPPKESAAWEEYHANLVINDLYRKDLSKAERRKREQELAALLEDDPSLLHFTGVEYAQQKDPLSIRLPERFRKYVRNAMYRKGNPLLGIRHRIWAVPIWGMLALVSLCWPWGIDQICTKIEEWNDRILCVDNPADELLFLKHRIKDSIQNRDYYFWGNFEQIDSSGAPSRDLNLLNSFDLRIRNLVSEADSLHTAIDGKSIVPLSYNFDSLSSNIADWASFDTTLNASRILAARLYYNHAIEAHKIQDTTLRNTALEIARSYQPDFSQAIEMQNVFVNPITPDDTCQGTQSLTIRLSTDTLNAQTIKSLTVNGRVITGSSPYQVPIDTCLFSRVAITARAEGFTSQKLEWRKGQSPIFDIRLQKIPEPDPEDTRYMITGNIRDSLGRAISDIQISYGEIASVQSNNEGEFTLNFEDIPPEAVLELRKPGYQELDRLLTSELIKDHIPKLELELLMLQEITEPVPQDSPGIGKPTFFLTDDNEEIPLPTLIPIPGGTFWMGSDDKESKDYPRERPRHQVRLDDFYMAETEVTNAQFAAFLNRNGRGNAEEGGTTWYEEKEDGGGGKISKTADGYAVDEGYENHPAVEVSWYGARAYCTWLSRITGQTYRLPTEAEWEYAAAGGPRGFDDEGNRLNKWAGTNDENTLSDYAWYKGDVEGREQAVRQKLPNHAGLYDMSGNVYEWVFDWYGSNYYETLQKDGITYKPQGPESGDYRVIRGGFWSFNAIRVRVAYRLNGSPVNRNFNIGFRPARD